MAGQLQVGDVDLPISASEILYGGGEVGTRCVVHCCLCGMFTCVYVSLALAPALSRALFPSECSLSRTRTHFPPHSPPHSLAHTLPLSLSVSGPRICSRLLARSFACVRSLHLPNYRVALGTFVMCMCILLNLVDS